jgi:hypothetical protein
MVAALRVTQVHARLVLGDNAPCRKVPQLLQEARRRGVALLAGDLYGVQQACSTQPGAFDVDMYETIHKRYTPLVLSDNCLC